MTKYPTPWQRKTMWAALTALFVVLLITIACSVIWIVANVVGFIQPILIPVAIALILAYLLEPLVTKLAAQGLGRTKAVLAIFTIAFLSIGVLVAWLAPVVSMQAASVGRELPQYTLKARDHRGGSHLSLRPHLRDSAGKAGKNGLAHFKFCQLAPRIPGSDCTGETFADDFASVPRCGRCRGSGRALPLPPSQKKRSRLPPRL